MVLLIQRLYPLCYPGEKVLRAIVRPHTQQHISGAVVIPLHYAEIGIVVGAVDSPSKETPVVSALILSLVVLLTRCGKGGAAAVALCRLHIIHTGDLYDHLATSIYQLLDLKGNLDPLYLDEDKVIQRRLREGVDDEVSGRPIRFVYGTEGNVMLRQCPEIGSFHPWKALVDAAYRGTDGIQPLVDILITAVDLLDVIDPAGTACGHGGDKEGDTGTYIR